MLKKLTRKLRDVAATRIRSAGFFRSSWYSRYEFQMSPRQLCYLAKCIDKIKNVEGSIVEIGCAHGLTTTFLYEYMIDSGFRKEYVCIDTFAGFTKEDILVEVDDRRKSEFTYTKIFKDNNPVWFREALETRNITDVSIIQADISELSENKLPDQIAFCLVDVDLYRPVLSALNKIYPRMNPDGIIVVDDCWYRPSPSFVPNVAEAYDGAMQAYREFTRKLKIPEHLVEDKLGIIGRNQVVA